MTTKTKKWNGSSWITKHKRLAIYLRDGFICCYCGRDLKGAKPCEINLDHLTPRSKGGDNDATNLITACKSCNSSRGNKSLEDYAPGGSLERIAEYRYKTLNIILAKALIAGTTGQFDN
jgi:5-methylcytosine-specific restriction endonuclease McrA